VYRGSITVLRITADEVTDRAGRPDLEDNRWSGCTAVSGRAEIGRNDWTRSTGRIGDGDGVRMRQLLPAGPARPMRARERTRRDASVPPVTRRRSRCHPCDRPMKGGACARSGAPARHAGDLSPCQSARAVVARFGQKFTAAGQTEERAGVPAGPHDRRFFFVSVNLEPEPARD
jgi:hypothetical protein